MVAEKRKDDHKKQQKSRKKSKSKKKLNDTMPKVTTPKKSLIQSPERSVIKNKQSKVGNKTPPKKRLEQRIKHKDIEKDSHFR